jgi:hypothetical protein
MRREDIRVGLRVTDLKNTPDMTYTWIEGSSGICVNCNFPDQYLLREDYELHNLRGQFCIDCAGLDDLEPLAVVIK